MTEPKAIIRIINTDLDGKIPIQKGLSKIRGVSFMFANALCNLLNLDKKKQSGSLSEEEIKKIEAVVKDPKDLPVWMLNRRKDMDTGKDKHLVGGEIRFVVDNDIKMMKKIKSYKGMRHAWGLPVRGQRTRGNFRHGKSIGVQKKAVQQGKK